MKLVIDIPKELYNYIQSESYDTHLDRRFDYRIRFAVREGKPLPDDAEIMVITDYGKVQITDIDTSESNEIIIEL